MLQAIGKWWRGYSRADMESVKERLRNLRKPSGASLKPSNSLKPLDNLPEIEV